MASRVFVSQTKAKKRRRNGAKWAGERQGARLAVLTGCIAANEAQKRAKFRSLRYNRAANVQPATPRYGAISGLISVVLTRPRGTRCGAGRAVARCSSTNDTKSSRKGLNNYTSAVSK